MNPHEPRYGLHTYVVKVSKYVHPSGVIYVHADSVTVANGVLMFAAEIHPAEQVEERIDEDGAVIPPPETGEGGLELPPVAIFAPGEWYSVWMVDLDMRPLFIDLG